MRAFKLALVSISLDSPPQATSTKARFTDAAAALRLRLKAPGLAAAAIDRDGAELVVGVGFADPARGLALTERTRLLGGSTGKTIFAATAFALARAGRIDLDSPISRWLGARPWFERLANADALTLRLLLQHASGLPDHMGQRAIVDALQQTFERGGPDAYLPPEDAIVCALDLPALHPPGQGFAYSDTNYVVAGLALEAALDSPLYTLAQTLVIEPFGLTATSPAIDRRIPDLATPHLLNDGEAVAFAAEDGGLQHSPRTEWAGGGYVTTARDLAQLGRCYASGRAFGKAPTQALNLYSWSDGHVGGYGLGLFAAQTRLGPSFGHGGYYPGFQSQFSYFPELDLSVAFQVNVSDAFGGYEEIVHGRNARALAMIAPGTPLSLADDGCVKLAAAFVG